MAVKAPPPPPAPIWTWTGFYVGVNAGGTWSGNNDIYSFGTPLFADPRAPVGTAAGLAASVAGVTTNVPNGRGSGFIGGAQAGYNWQFNKGVVGVEADIQGLSGKRSGLMLTTVPTPAFPGNNVNTSLATTGNVDWLGTLRGRLGFLASPSLLLYGTGGLAFGDVKSSTTINQIWTGNGAVATVNAPYGSFASISQTRAGWAAGVGGEWKFAPRWSAKLEYLHYDLGRVSYSGTLNNVVAPPGGSVPTGGVFYSLAATSSMRANGDIVRVGVNYAFTGPVVAKY
jgi:outer membrane immunogenic protein